MAATTADDSRPPAPIPALDGLRAFAVVLVVLFHSGHLDGGFLGVDLFFVLSGYLITTLLLAEHDQTGSIRFTAFWARRARRLVPALALLLIATLVAVALLFDLESVGANRDEALASALYVSNWWTIHTPAPYLTIFQHTWSLSIEAQFYLVWPVVLAVVLRGRPGRRRATTRVLAVSAVGAVAAALLMALLYDGDASLARVYFGTDTRSIPILFGAALAALVFGARGRPSRWSRGVLDVGASITAVAFVGITMVTTRTEPSLYEGAYAVVICPALTLLVATAALTDGLFARALALPPVRALGLISYGVYLWHWPVMYLLNANRLHLEGWPLLAAQALITVAIATASYVFVEQPIRQRRLPFTRARRPLAR
jgi:peptidoglycan/LPS O-acetylase OafA/YrhL